MEQTLGWLVVQLDFVQDEVADSLGRQTEHVQLHCAS